MNLKKITIIIVSILFVSCSSVSDELEESLNSNSPLTFQFNGENRTSLPLISSASFVESTFGDTTFYGFGLAGGTTNLSGNGWILSLVISFGDLEEFTAGQSWTNSNIEEGFSFLGIYSETLGEDELFGAESDDTTSFQVTITELDKENQTVSGTFSFEGLDSSTGEQSQITNGRFNNLTYTTN